MTILDNYYKSRFLNYLLLIIIRYHFVRIYDRNNIAVCLSNYLLTSMGINMILYLIKESIIKNK